MVKVLVFMSLLAALFFDISTPVYRQVRQGRSIPDAANTDSPIIFFSRNLKSSAKVTEISSVQALPLCKRTVTFIANYVNSFALCGLHLLGNRVAKNDFTPPQSGKAQEGFVGASPLTPSKPGQKMSHEHNSRQK